MKNPNTLKRNQCRVTLIHVTDIHWHIGSEAYSSTSVVDSKEAVLNRISLFRTHLERIARNSAEHAVHRILVFGGDIFKEGGYLIDQVSVMQKELVEPLLSLKTKDGSPLFTAVMAVPGNHDIIDPNRQSKHPLRDYIGHPMPDEFDKFHRFKCWAAMLRLAAGPISVITPFDSKIYRVVLGHLHPKKIAFWLVNSATKCGQLDSSTQQTRKFWKQLVEHINSQYQDKEMATAMVDMLKPYFPEESRPFDPCYVEQHSRIEYEEELKCENDDLRVAVMHHNCMPTLLDDIKKHSFVDQGTFTNFLIRNEFRLLVHGHQHLCETVFRSDVDSSQDGVTFHPQEHGFLSVGGPAFDTLGTGITHRGFNVITIEADDESDICDIEIVRHLWQPKDYFAPETTHYIVATGHLADQVRRDCLTDAYRLLYSNRSINGVSRGLDDRKYRGTYSANLSRLLGGFQDIRSAYVFSVFEPGRWQGNKISEFLMPLGRENIKIAATLGAQRSMKVSGSEAPSLLFVFSKPLMHGIRTAASNAPCKSTTVAAVARGTSEHEYLQASNFTFSRLSGQAGDVLQMSVFGQAIMRQKGCDVALEAGASRAHVAGDDLTEVQVEDLGQLFEFARIVSWTFEDFLKPSTLDIIELHETFGFPLLWIDPDLLRTRGGEKRRRIGYWAVNKYNATLEEREYKEIMHSNRGERAGNDHYMSELAWNSKTPDLWALPKAEMGLPEHKFNRHAGNDKALHEFIWLLGHPALCFAADAWTAAYAGETFFERFRSRLETKLTRAFESTQVA